jgi:phospholipid/cholesterol/gamma-HCH transport system substrate-binding protein
MTSDATFKRRALALGLFLLACVVALALMYRYAGGDLTPTKKRYEVQAVVPSAVSLATHADIRQAGVRIGRVEKIAPRGNNIVLLLQLDPDHAPVYNDARVLVRAKTLTGENYVDLDPGTPAKGRVVSGGVLSLAHAGRAVQFDELLSTFDRRRRADLQRLLKGLGRGLGDRGADLNAFIEGSDATVRATAPVAATLGADRAQVASLVDDLGRVLRSLGDRRDAIRVMTQRSKVLAEAVAARDASLRQTLHDLPGFLAQARQTTDKLGNFSTRATPVVRDLRLATEQTVPTFKLLRPTTARARRAMQALSTFTHEANPLAAHLRPFAQATAKFTPELESLLRQVNPMLAYAAPFEREFTALFSTMRNGSELYDAIGHFGRTTDLVSKSGVPGHFTPEQQAAYDALISSGALTEVEKRGLNPYPKPGEVDVPKPFDGRYPRITADPPYNR